MDEVDEKIQEQSLRQPNYFKLEKGKHFLDEFMAPFYEIRKRFGVCTER